MFNLSCGKIRQMVQLICRNGGIPLDSSSVRMIGKRRNIIIVLGLFIVVLIGLRLLWIGAFMNKDQPFVANGELDLRGWDASSSRTLSLDGEWEFYPSVFLLDETHQASSDTAAHLLQVPGGWNDSLRPGESTPYGFGSYRLRILVDPGKETTYGVHIPSVRSSSELFVNGRLLASSGQPAAVQELYKPWNLPYFASFQADGSNVIEIVIQAANFQDSRKSGIVRSIKFGTRDAIYKEANLTSTMQLIIAVSFMLHALYALIIYFVGNRDKRLLYLSLLIICALFNILMSGDNKLLHYWIPFGYEWGFKLVNVAMIIVAYSLVQCIRPQLPPWWRIRIHAAFGVLCGVTALLYMLLPVRHMFLIDFLFYLVVGIAVSTAVISLVRSSPKEIKDNVLLLLSIIAFASNFVWWLILNITGIKVVYYPFDLILAMIAFSSIWFQRYFRYYDDAQKLAAKLQKDDRMKDEFLANTSHELRNPLHGILNISEAVLEREKQQLKTDSVRDLEMVLTVGRRMSVLLNDLLDLVRLKDSAIRLQPESISVQTVATGVVDMLRFMTEGKPIRLINRIPDHFPPVIADENRLIQIMFNLLHNAVKFTDEGEISIQAEARNGVAHIRISDTGIGMEKGTIPRAFEAYEQGSPEEAALQGGFGLGLSICKRLVELHGGTIGIDSVRGKGTTFTFTLQLSGEPALLLGPRAIDGLAAVTLETASTDSASLPDALSEPRSPFMADRNKILAVDDDPVNLSILKNLLTPEQHELVTATSGREALVLLESGDWDLVISDVMMPHMSGYELTRSIRKHYSLADLPVLLLTARSRPEDIENGFASGANDYITKPVDAKELRSRVRSLTETRRAARERLRMEAAWLQAQIQPHFLFNTLNTVAALSEIDIERMRKLLEQFGYFLQETYHFHNTDELIPLEYELDLVRSYVYIEKERFDDRLQIVWELNGNTDLLIPPLTIQPLVENAIRHGVLKRVRGGEIRIRMQDVEDGTEISVIDDGVGMEESQLRQLLDRSPGKASGIGMINTDLRLRRYFGNGLQIDSKPGEGTSISFIVKNLDNK